MRVQPSPPLLSRPVCFFPAALLWMELVYRAFYVDGFWGRGLLFLTVFSLPAGLLCGLLCCIWSPKANRIAARVLTQHGVTDRNLTASIVQAVGQGASGAQPMGMTPHSKEIMEFAAAEAASHGAGYIGTEHMLMALIREGDNYGLRILQAMGADTRAIYRALEQSMGGQSADLTGPEESPKGKSKGELTLPLI